MSEIYGDAFASDKKEDRLYGQSIVESVCSFAYENEIDDIPPLKSNNVSFMKVEDLPFYCRNILAISESYICYSVTQRKNLLRIINTVIGEKVILRGHDSAVLDLKFSPVDSNALCSVDDGDDVTKSHTMVWEKQEQGDWKITYELPLQANIVRAHPCQANVWMIANKNCIGIFNTKSAKTQPIKSYNMLPMNITCGDDEVVIDASFSSNGLYVIVTTIKKVNVPEDDYFITIYQIGSSNTGSSLIRGTEELLIKTRLTSLSFLKSLKAVQIIGDYLFTVMSSTSASVDSFSYTINIWNVHTYTLTAESSIQTLHINFPISKSTFVSSALQNSSLECALCIEPSKHRYMILSSRKSHLVACIAINPDILKHSQNGSSIFIGLPLYHCTYLHLRAPIVSMDVTTILGQDHHSADQGEHLELCCYQETASDPGQASIQQYHILFSHLFNFQNYLNLPQIKNKNSTEAMIPLATLLEGKSTNIISESSPRVLSSSETNSNSGITNKGMTILNMLNSFTRSTSNSTIPQMTSPGIVKAPPKSEEASPNVIPVATTSDSSNTSSKMSGLPDFLTSQTAQPNTSILGMLKAAKTNSAITSTATPSNPSNSAVAISTPSLSAINLAAEITASELTKSEIKITSSISTKPISSAKVDVSSDIPSTSSTSSIPSNDILVMLKSFQQNQQSLQKVQQESFQKLIKDLQTSHSKSNEQLAASVKKSVDQDMKDTKESIEKYLSESQWKNEITESLIRELIPAVTNKVRDSVRDTVKTQLASTFKTCFESALLPAFEAGVQAMFQQMQTVLAQGMQGLVYEVQNTQKLTVHSNETLEIEIKSLRDTVSRLENSLDALHKSISLMSAQQSAQYSEVVPDDAFTLLSKGLISDAIVRVLEDKDISITIALLDRLTPSQVNAECSHLERLCITQQLAADMSVNKPIEGIEKRIVWIKSLVLSLLTTKGSSSKDGQIAAQKLDPNYDAHFKTMISVVLDSIAAAKEMIFSSQFDNGEEIPGNMQISQSVCTDLQLLEFVIQSKMDS